ncbi:hypothetical protein M9Y10_005161 [Tritrichomonas musculus]|uniref:DUF3447 domain-containing protein n=1 Tax=Tritrichomonas musculus TaxID=1915356 RepID=A0ABR2JLU0_9EUKA
MFMNIILKEQENIKIYAEIQRTLCALTPDANEEEIDQLFTKIPANFLTQKDTLMVICQLFAYYARIHQASIKGNTIKLFERILDTMKKNLQDESSFLWNIFGGLFNFKLWMYEEGLITIDQIITSAQHDQSSAIYEFFIPEIIEKEPEIFEKEIKNQITFSYSEESIQKFKELRRKYWKWLRESGDYHDPSYLEIEHDQLRLAIKRDDIDSFQKILSNSCLSVNSNIRESVIENFLRNPTDLPLIEYAVHFNSMNIFKFLFLNDAKIDHRIVYGSIQSKNYDIIHLVESKVQQGYGEDSLPSSIECWNDEMTEYILDNYDCDIFKNDTDIKNKVFLLSLLSETFYSLNFVFMESTLLPFLKNNPSFVDENIYDIIMETFSEMSCFFTKEFLKYPGLDINYHAPNYNISFMARAIQERNSRAIEILLNNPKLDINSPCFMTLPSLHLACQFRSDMKIIRLICTSPNIKINLKDNLCHTSAFMMAVSSGNFYATKYLIDNFTNLEEKDLAKFFFPCIKYHHLMTLKVILKYFIDQNKNVSEEQIISNFISQFSKEQNYLSEYPDKIREIIHEINTM